MFQLHSLTILSGNAFHLPYAIILKPEDAIIFTKTYGEEGGRPIAL